MLATASLVVAVCQAVVRWLEYRDKRKAHIAVDIEEDVRVEADRWEVAIWLTNVGRSHARRVHVWLVDDADRPLCAERRLPRPLMSGDESTVVHLSIPRDGRSGIVARPARSWRDGRDVTLRQNVSNQRITLP
jgi:hypothetical protein